MDDLSLLSKPIEEQAYIAIQTTDPEILDILSNSNNTYVRMTVLSNPSVSDETLKRKIDDEDPHVWSKAAELLEQKRNRGV